MAIHDNGSPPGGRHAEPALVHHPAALATLAFENAEVGLAIIDGGGKLLAVNSFFRDLTGIPPDQALPDVDIGRLMPIGSALSLPLMPSSPGQGEWHEVYLSDAEGSEGELLLSVSALDGDGSRLLTLVPRGLLTGGLPARDALTGLGSPSLFKDRLDHAIARAERHERPLAVLLVALDRPPRRTSQVRWQLLEQVARRLRRVLREEDSLARLGDGRWGVIIEHPMTPQSLHAVALRLQEAMDAPFDQEGGSTLLTLSIGIARFPEDAEDGAALMEEAALALEQSRRLGPGTHAFRDRGLRKHIEARETLLEQLQAALLSPTGHFQLVFQPQCDARTGRWAGLEALVRWPRPRHGMAYPGELLPAVRELGGQVRLDRWVLGQVIALRAAWQASGVGLASLPLSVNLMAETLEQEVFDGCPLDHFLKRYPQPLTGLCLELPAAALDGLGENRRHLLKRLQRMGVTLVADGLGTAPVSLVALPALGVSGAKLAPAMMAEMDQSRLVRQGARGLIAGLHELGLATVAVGVETSEQFERVKRLGVAGVQGCYLCPPLTADELTARWGQDQP
jgi:diguanylate cyclase (GGDEF)-like protein